MGNKEKRAARKAAPCKLSIELLGDKVIAGQNLRGQAVINMFDVYRSVGGLDKARLTLIGLERTRFCEQKKDAPKKIKNRQLMENQKQIHYSLFNIHDF